MHLFLTILLVLGAGMVFAHQQKRTDELYEKKVEYRYLPLPLDDYLRQQQYSASNVMGDMINQTQGYCSVSHDTTPVWETTLGTPMPTDVMTPVPLTTPVPTQSPSFF